MKFSLAFISLILCLSASAQKTELYYDYNWRPCKPAEARFFCTLEKTDSGWFRNDYFIGSMSLQMRALYKDSACKIQNGYCTYFHANKVLAASGRILHNKAEGVYVHYHSNGMMADSAFYHNGIPSGIYLSWHRNGYLSDSISHVNDSMDVHVSWFADGVLASAGYQLNGKPHGKWQFFHHNGKLSSLEVFDKGKPLSKEYFNEDGSPATDTSNANRETVIKNGGADGWKKYLEKNLYWPRGLQFATGNMAVVVVEFTINELGKVENEEVVVPFHPEFDKIALRTIHNSPEWIPAVAHNRKVKFRFRQPVTFQQQEE
jgi:TonB family protein